MFSETENVTVTFDGTERQWRMMAKDHTGNREVTLRGEWDKAPYYRTDETRAEKQTVVVSPMRGCKKLTVHCKKDGAILRYGF